MDNILMDTIDLSKWQDDFVIHFGGQLHQVNANTYANSLINIASILEEINLELKTNHKIEIKIDAVGEGSFRSKIRLAATSLKNLFDNVLLHPYNAPSCAIISILIALIALKQSGGSTNNIEIKDSTVIIQKDNSQIIMPKIIYDESLRIYKNNQKVQDNLSNTFDTLQEDPSVSDFGITKGLKDKKFAIYAHSETFSNLASKVELKEQENVQAIIKEQENLQIIKAVFEKSKRKWEFVWNGIKISANIDDDNFFEQMAKGQVSFKQGDSLQVRLKINQTYDPYSKVWLNQSYEIIQVIDHISYDNGVQRKLI